MALVHLAVVELVDRRLGARSLSFFQLRQNPIARVAQNFDLDDHAPEALPHQRILEGRHAVATERAADLEQATQVGLMSRHAGKGVAAALEAKRGLRQLPALAFLA